MDPWAKHNSKLDKKIFSVPRRHSPIALREYSIFDDSRFPTELRKELVALHTKDVHLDRAMGCLVGNLVGDAVGAPLEFLEADTSTVTPGEKDRPHLYLDQNILGKKRWKYRHEFNKFGLERGQWTDDGSMALCLADTLLVHNEFNGADVRIRWWQWWHQGLNNAFKRMTGYRPRSSVGLGGNIAASLGSIRRLSKLADVRPIYMPRDPDRRNDAGNGSLMRNGAVPVRFHQDIAEAERVGSLQTRASHPGPDASASTRFLSYFCVKAINRPTADGKTTKQFVEETAAGFVADHKEEFVGTDANPGMVRMKMLLENTAQTLALPNDIINLNWKDERLQIEEAIENRGGRGARWNGPHPVLPSYQGAWSLDGISMALWSVYHNTNFDDTVVACVNLLGDADTTGAIAAQMAGALYGYSTINKIWKTELNRWDDHETAARAVLLFSAGQPGKTF